ncbi:protein phosphatase regulator [Coprinopsis cinerea okayama7|uniref:Protein phosphatase regulator n=1 Tax=Coprinopsis cinerea (strain Okayama-7 / 130 / ATCC MYA-4618 / FGSC 9003) TaxID=240176 RepID=A8PAA0_COPC7|nr:protein phosphatase regulator [Coprinopsis cinerea okayama7\|eukprot:XP_001839941.2 protein phosphatase regulator [Coprinopsis cinerea okayama7\
MAHHSQPLYSNAAVGCLPTLPRRTSTSRATLNQPIKRTPKSPGVHRLRRSVSSGSESDSSSVRSSSSGSATPLSLRARRARGPNPPPFPEPLTTTPVTSLRRHEPADPSTSSTAGGLKASKTEDNITLSQKKGSGSHPMIYVPGMSLRHGFPSTPSSDAPKSAAGIDAPKPIRKKSGQLVKPSLKSSRSTGDVGYRGLTSSKSEPTTPISKAVHFDSQLEHVKLFLAEQKPLAVSRDGSPTDDTSGTDSDFPSFIFGDSEDRRRSGRRRLVLDVVNMPPRINLPRGEVTLESMSLSTPHSSSIVGVVRVRNIAYAKLVTVRFTFDSWQTLSEVTARYSNSPSPEYDRFTFTINLTDILARIEEKTLVLAVRYSVAGQEFWDNNNTLNYVAKFSRVLRDRALSDEEVDDSKTGNLASLQNKLEKVVQGKEVAGGRSGPPAFLASPRQPSPVDADPETPTFKSTTSFAARYDFSASLKNPWRYQDTPVVPHLRTNSFPQFTKPGLASRSPPPPSSYSPSPSFSTKPVLPLGSPRDLTECATAVPVKPATTHSDDVEIPFPISPPRAETRSPTRHHRRGYFDMNAFHAPNVKHTPPISPRLNPTVGIYVPDNDDDDGVLLRSPILPLPEPPKSAPPALSLNSGFGVGAGSLGTMVAGLFGGDTSSEISTPSLGNTPTSSRDTTPSPVEGFKELPSTSTSASASTSSSSSSSSESTESEESDGPPSPEDHYRELISQYCFFTGFEDGLVSSPVQDGALLVESSFNIPPSKEGREREEEATPRLVSTRFGFDTVVVRGGSLTPTESRSATPVPFVV